ncbi:Malolactic regulator [Lacticaseibacillus rhamnosus]|nr:Malolactic regulator [Lacticaseibacillus rhamnosus]MCT3177792.1 Malolactic regulator [Lacticaseibacillus rhamnosus]MCT3184440.1 Malolactic regulator [Lacticaseibacillus rhamnosus]MCT4450040.1 Malolactic regulator [Lacticaseibacillus rhamnosus]
MAKIRPSRPRPLMFWFMPITRSPAQGSACKDLERDGQERAITFEAAYVLVYAHNALTGAETCV